MDEKPLTSVPARRLTVPLVLPLAKAYVCLPENGAGGSLHIVLDDLNLADGHVKFCREWAWKEEDYPGLLLAECLLRMSRSQRARIATRCYDTPQYKGWSGELIATEEEIMRKLSILLLWVGHEL